MMRNAAWSPVLVRDWWAPDWRSEQRQLRCLVAWQVGLEQWQRVVANSCFKDAEHLCRTFINTVFGLIGALQTAFVCHGPIGIFCCKALHKFDISAVSSLYSHHRST